MEKTLKFIEESHKYLYGNEEFISVTTFIGNVLFEPFDEIKISELMVLKTDRLKTDKYYGKNALEIREIWEIERNNGINMHKMIEKYYTGIRLTRLEVKTTEFKMFKNFESDHIQSKNLIPYHSEWKVFDKELKMAGTIDMVYRYNNISNPLIVIIYDWKRIYEYALKNDFRFLSYGDGCLLFV